MGGGGWVFEGRVICESYPAPVEGRANMPEVRSVAGWGYAGTVERDGEDAIEIGDEPATKPAAKDLEKEFWDIDDAIAYANGEDDGIIAQVTSPVRVTWSKSGYKIREP
jgi:hypothetical protein